MTIPMFALAAIFVLIGLSFVRSLRTMITLLCVFAIVIIGGVAVIEYDPAFLASTSPSAQPAHMVAVTPVVTHVATQVVQAPVHVAHMATAKAATSIPAPLFPAIAGGTLLGVLISVVILVCIIALVNAKLRASRKRYDTRAVLHEAIDRM